MDKRIPPDQAAREKIAVQLDSNFLVEAGAGSGKTTSLVKRMVNMILSGHYQVSEIVAITFTRKAADELRERFQTALEKHYREEQNSDRKELLEIALNELDRCFLGTIHSFCAKLLRERPIEAKIDPVFEELEEAQDLRIKDFVWHRYLQELSQASPDQLESLSKLGISPFDLHSAFVELSRYPDVEIVRERIDQPEWREVFAESTSLLSEAARAIREDELKDNYSFELNILRCRRLLRYVDKDHAGDIMKFIGRLNKKPKVTQKCWTSKDDAKHYEAKLADLVETKIAPLVTRWHEYCHAHMIDLLIPAIERYEVYKSEKSLVNFADLLMKTASLLRDNPEVRVYFQDKYRSLLVDEFQDTDPIQAQIMFYLTGENHYEADWKKVYPKAGSLFVVGDPKQAIYRFRRADIDTYNLVKQLITETGGEALSLTANFRSVSSITEAINPVFQELLPAEENQYQAAYQPLQAMREAEADTVDGVFTYTIPAEYSKKDELVNQDAQLIAKYIKWALDGNLQIARTEGEKALGMTPAPSPKDFMILLRYKDSINVYARALEQYGIPNLISGGSSFAESEEIHELYKLVLFLGDVENQLHLLSVLKGAFFGLSDETLYQWKASGGVISLYTAVPEALALEHRSILEGALQKLQLYSQWTRQYRPVVALEKMMTDIGLIAFSATSPMGRNRCSYLYQLLELLRGPAAGAITHFSDLASAMKTLVDAEIEEELNMLGEETDAVRIMNLHKAKGLEAPVVFLAHPAVKVDAAKKVSKHIKRDGDMPKGYFTIFLEKAEYQRDTIAQPLDWITHFDAEGRYLEEEEVRLLYVAATRAKNLLLIGSSAKDKKNPWMSLLSASAGELTIPDVDIPQPSVCDLVMTLDMVNEGKKHYSDWHEQLQSTTYQMTSPTALAEGKAESSQIARESGGGLQWGSIVHRVFEWIVQSKGDGKDLDTFLEMTLLEYGEQAARKQELLEMVDRFKQTSLWKRILHAEEVYTEVPFSLQENREIVQIVTGVIDLAIKDQTGWTIVDYKTDRLRDKADIDRLLDLYKPQIHTYTRIWQQLTGEAVTGAEIYLVEEDELYQI